MEATEGEKRETGRKATERGTEGGRERGLINVTLRTRHGATVGWARSGTGARNGNGAGSAALSESLRTQPFVSFPPPPGGRVIVVKKWLPGTYFTQVSYPRQLQIRNGQKAEKQEESKNNAQKKTHKRKTQ